MAGTSVPLTPQRIQVCVAKAPGDHPIAPLCGVPDALDGESVWCRGEEGGMLLFGEHHHFTKPGVSADPDFVNRVMTPGTLPTWRSCTRRGGRSRRRSS